MEQEQILQGTQQKLENKFLAGKNKIPIQILSTFQTQKVAILVRKVPKKHNEPVT